MRFVRLLQAALTTPSALRKNPGLFMVHANIPENPTAEDPASQPSWVRLEPDCDPFVVGGEKRPEAIRSRKLTSSSPNEAIQALWALSSGPPGRRKPVACTVLLGS